MPLAYHGYAAVEATLEDGATTAIAMPALAPVASTVASATLVPPGGGRLALVQLAAQLGPHASLTVYQRLIVQPGEPPLPVTPRLLLPADGVAGVIRAMRFSAVTDGAAPVTFVWEPVGAGPRLALTTSRREAVMPDAAAVGLALPAGAAYRWMAESHGPVGPAESTRDIQNALQFSAIVRCGPGPTSDGELAISKGREFTLAP